MSAAPETTTRDQAHLLEVDDLQVRFTTRRGEAHAVRGVSFHIARGETLGLVGESGSGKSVTALATLGLIESPGRVSGGTVRWKGEVIVSPSGPDRRLQAMRGNEVALVFQDPMTSLNPLMTISNQIGEVLRRHRGLSKRDAEVRVVELLDLVGIAFPKQRARQRPHELSGGMRQRVMIAMALACEPELLIADEPTTALDVTIQAQVLELVADLRDQLGLAVLLITHDLGVVAGMCDRVAVMYGGKLVEIAPADALYARPRHQYTRGLLDSTPRLDVVLPRLVPIGGTPPDLISPTPGCPFADRCGAASERCRTEMPPLVPSTTGGDVACWHPVEAAQVQGAMGPTASPSPPVPDAGGQA